MFVLNRLHFIGLLLAALPVWAWAQGLQDSSAYLRSDHPGQPETHWLQQPLTAGDQALSVYAGTVRLDSQGEAIVKLPEYFQDLHRSVVSYQLTPLDRALQIYVKDRVKENRFSIRASQGLQAAGAEISWMVIALRDAPAFAEPRFDSEPIKAHPGKYARSDVYQYHDVLHLSAEKRQALFVACKDMAAQIEKASQFVDAVIIGSYAFGIARGMNTGDPSDLDIALVLKDKMTIDQRMTYRSQLLEANAKELQEIIGLDNPIDLMFLTPSEAFPDDPATVYFRLSTGEMVGRPGTEPLHIKHDYHDGRWFRFSREDWQRAEVGHWFDNAEKHLTQDGHLEYRNRESGDVILRSKNTVKP